MSRPRLYLLAGSNGAGKTTFYEQVIRPATGLPFVNADVIAAERWPEDAEAHGHEAAALAARTRSALLARGSSFVTETVFSHPSKVELVSEALALGYDVYLRVMVVPVELTVARVRQRVINGGHSVPEDRVRARHARLWAYVRTAAELATNTIVYDNSSIDVPYRPLVRFESGHPPRAVAVLPDWLPDALRPVTG